MQPTLVYQVYASYKKLKIKKEGLQMLKVTNIAFVYDKDWNVPAYTVNFDGDSETIQMLSGQITLLAEEIDLSKVTGVVEAKIRKALEPTETTPAVEDDSTASN